MNMQFDAVNDDASGAGWLRRWHRSWPAYEAWFIARGGDAGPDLRACHTALARFMPELVPVHERLVALTGGTDRAARFLSTWCPPQYLGGCSLAAMSDGEDVRLVRNYDLSPDLNEGLLLRSEWTGRPVMGMVEFLWGLSDGINDAGLTVALAYGGRSETRVGFGITTILRYVLEICSTVDEAIAVFRRVPSHMAYNIVLADASGATASLELTPGGGVRRMPHPIATNHQSGPHLPDRSPFTRTYERHRHLSGLSTDARNLHRAFTSAPLRQVRYSEGFGTLFTCEYDPEATSLRLIWPDQDWHQSLSRFDEGQRIISFDAAPGQAFPIRPWRAEIVWTRAACLDWSRVARDYANGSGRPIADYLSDHAPSRYASASLC